jgi:hypothetical protein
MSSDAWTEEHWIGEAVLPRPRRAPKLPALPVPHAPTCSHGNAALAAHAQSRDSARHPGDGLSASQDRRNVVDRQARKLTQPVVNPLGLVSRVGVSGCRRLDRCDGHCERRIEKAVGISRVAGEACHCSPRAALRGPERRGACRADPMQCTCSTPLQLADVSRTKFGRPAGYYFKM